VDHKNDSDKNKKAYEKPVVTQVELVADEAVLAACKTGIDIDCLPDITCSDLAGS